MEFIPLVRAKVRSMYPECRDYYLTDADKAAIQALVESKYDTWDWNFGKSRNIHSLKQQEPLSAPSNSTSMWRADSSPT